MPTWRPALNAPWSPVEMESVLADALRVLAEIGVACRHPVMVARLCERFGERAGDRVRFRPDRAREHLERRRQAQAATAGGSARGQINPVLSGGDDEFGLGGCWAGINYCDPVTQQVRPATSAECAAMCRLWDARGIANVVPVVPGDVPPELQTLTAERIALNHSRALGGLLTVQDPEEVRYLIDMNLAAGRRYALAEQVGISPLRFNDAGIETALRFAGNPDVDVQMAGFIPMAGATAPLDPRSGIVQAVAEELAYSMACEAIGLAREGFSLRLDPFDFQYALIVFGSPEWCLYRTLVNAMGAYLNGRPTVYGSFRSTAKRPDEQAAAERMASALWQALLGARRFGAVGQLSVDEVFSPQQAVIDREILAYVARLIRGLEFRPEIDPVALIREGVEQNGFSGLADTVDRFRSFCAFPELFRHWNVERWRAEQEPSVLGEAWLRAQEEISRSTHRLRPDQEKAVDALYRKAVEYVRLRTGNR